MKTSQEEISTVVVTDSEMEVKEEVDLEVEIEMIETTDMKEEAHHVMVALDSKKNRGL
jgi:hypothetical protein